jgi:hypothetical protein
MSASRLESFVSAYPLENRVLAGRTPTEVHGSHS